MSELNCEQLPGRLKHICRGYDDDGNPVLTPEKVERYRKFFVDGQFGNDHAPAAAYIEKVRIGDKTPLTKATAQQAWLALHTYPVEHADDWDEKAARKFYQDWLTTVPSYGCSCKSNWLRYTRDNQPVFKSARGFFDWSVVAHNHVSTHHAEPRKPAITMAEAAAIHGAPWSYV